MKIIIVIPARWNSKRFRGKPLAKINGKEVIHHVYDKASLSKFANRVIVATDDKRIKDFCNKKDIDIIMTSKKNKTGTDRIYEVSKKIKSDIYVNVQGDEPLIKPNSIDKVILSLKKNILKKIEVATGYSKIMRQYQEKDTSDVFLVKSLSDQAIYFFRSKVSSKSENEIKKKENNIYKYKHIGLYAYTRRALKRFHSYKIGSLEVSESLEQMRFLENGEKIICTQLNELSLAVDYPKDIKKIENFLKSKKI
ncbi:MAG: 3-deoxy-manno-octulosonate cytidylyltransferase [Planctomycetota bacterium]|nr:3-deoxy-manno-octulosonate cytidylyltransferase [Planctomycetota bacterium]